MRSLVSGINALVVDQVGDCDVDTMKENKTRHTGFGSTLMMLMMMIYICMSCFSKEELGSSPSHCIVCRRAGKYYAMIPIFIIIIIIIIFIIFIFMFIIIVIIPIIIIIIIIIFIIIIINIRSFQGLLQISSLSLLLLLLLLSYICIYIDCQCATEFGKNIWQQWWNMPSFSLPCERKCVDSGGKTVIRALIDDIKELFTASAQKDWLAELNRPHARRGEGGNKLRTYAMFKSK